MDTQSLQLDEFSFGSIRVVPRRRELLRKGMKIELGDRAFDLLLALVGAQGSVLSKDQLIAQLWQGRIVEENTIEGQISSLRKAGETVSISHSTSCTACRPFPSARALSDASSAVSIRTRA